MTSLAKLSPVVNISELNSIMFATCGLLGFFSGLIAGQMGEGRLLFGLKHTIILLLLTYLVFTILMGY
jgi:flagellar protein FlaJ